LVLQGFVEIQHPRYQKRYQKPPPGGFSLFLVSFSLCKDLAAARLNL
jgi:hypothetical protein